MPSSSRSVEELDAKAANDVPVEVTFTVCPQMKIIISSSSCYILYSLALLLVLSEHNVKEKPLHVYIRITKQLHFSKHYNVL